MMMSIDWLLACRTLPLQAGATMLLAYDQVRGLLQEERITLT